MDIKKLNYFIHVAELGSLTRAAIALGMEQSTLSRHIRGLEDELKVSLFYRDGRGVSITVAGDKLLARSRKIMAELSMLTHDLATLTKAPSGRLKLGLPPTVAEALSAPLILEFSQRFPHMTLEIIEAMSGVLYEWLTGDRIDVAVLYLTATTRNLVAEPLLTEPLLFCAHPSRTRDLPGAVTLSALKDVPLALPGTSHGLRAVVEAAAKKANVELDIRYDVNSIATIKQMIAKNRACSLLPACSVRRESQSGTIVALPVAGTRLTRTLLLANGAQVTPAEPVRQLHRLIKRLMRDVALETGACGTESMTAMPDLLN